MMLMSPLAGKTIAKMNGLGNEIAVLDLRGTGLTVSAEEARAIYRGEGLAFDQLMVLHEPRSAGADASMLIFNSDGSQAGACGNGTRCAAFLLMRGSAREKLILETAAARLECLRRAANIFTVDMGEPRFAWNEIPLRDPVCDTTSIALLGGSTGGKALQPPSAVSMGNPHAIFWIDDIEAYDLAKIGPLLENHPIFPERANISLAQVITREHIVLKVWERGTGLTLACGSAACAALAAAARKGLTGRQAIVSLPGGDLTIFWRESDGHILMTGPVEFEFETRLDPKLFESIAV
jgi:diaminopimelate epimerase